MENMPLVSVVIPMYNASKYIEETLLSLANQSYPNFEVIIVDNGSTDNSVILSKKMECSFKSLNIIELDENSGGPAKPRNVGVSHATGVYVAFLDSDDIWDKDKLLIQLTLMEDCGYNFTCTSRLLVDENSKKFERKLDKVLVGKTGECSLSDLIRRNNITTSSVVVKRDLLMGFKFNELPVINCVEDYLLWLNLLNNEQCRFYHIKEPLVHYRLFETSLSRRDGRGLYAKSMLSSCFFMVENNRTDLLLKSLLSHLTRFFLISLFR